MDEISWRSLFARSLSVILTLRWRANSRELTIKIRPFEFHHDRWSHQGEDMIVSPNFKTLEILSPQQKMHSWMFQVIEMFRHLNPWISWSLPLLDFFSHPRSGWNWDFIEKIGRFHLFNAEYHFWKCRNKSLWFGDQLDPFEHDFGLDYVFSS